MDEVKKYFSKLGKKGGDALIKKYGPEHMSTIAKKGWKTRKKNLKIKQQKDGAKNK